MPDKVSGFFVEQWLMSYKKHILKNGLWVMLAPMRSGNMKSESAAEIFHRIMIVNG